jgi:hypothetical protein
MAIDYVVESQIEGNFYNDTENKERNLKWAWRNIKWKQIFDIIGFRIDGLYNNLINYWSLDQVNKIYVTLKILYNNPAMAVCCEEDLKTAEKMKPDILLLMKYFEKYVENKCVIIVF